MKTAYLLNLGVVDYQEGLALQERLAYLRQAGEIEDTLVLLEHPPCVTFGKKSNSKKASMIKVPLEELERRVPVYDVGRGGFVTYHEPGQLVAYPILNFSNLANGTPIPFVETLRTLARYVNGLEETMIQTAKVYGLDLVRKRTVDTRSLFRHVGVWHDDPDQMRKVGSIGVETRSYPPMKITMHGLAFNVNNSLELTNLVYPCGLDIEESSLSRLLGHDLHMDEVRDQIASQFARIFDYELTRIRLDELPMKAIA